MTRRGRQEDHPAVFDQIDFNQFNTILKCHNINTIQVNIYSSERFERLTDFKIWRDDRKREQDARKSQRRIAAVGHMSTRKTYATVVCAL